jgi:hypothetical protein
LQLTNAATLKILESDQFDTAWKFANRRAHDQIVEALTGRKSGAVTNSDGKVVLNLGPLAEAVVRRLSSLGLGVPKNLDVSRLNVRYVLIDSQDLKSVQTYARWLDRLAWVLPLITVLLYGAAVLIGPRRRRALMGVGVGITIATAVSLIGYGFGRTIYLDNLPGTGSHEAGAVIFDTITRFVERGLRTMLALGLLVWLATWLAGPSRASGAVRRQWNRALGRAGSGIGDGSPGPVNRWVAANATGLRVGVVALLLVVLLLWERPTGLVVAMLAGVGLLGVAAIQLLGAAGTSPDPA